MEKLQLAPEKAEDFLRLRPKLENCSIKFRRQIPWLVARRINSLFWRAKGTNAMPSVLMPKVRDTVVYVAVSAEAESLKLKIHSQVCKNTKADKSENH